MKISQFKEPYDKPLEQNTPKKGCAGHLLLLQATKIPSKDFKMFVDLANLPYFNVYFQRILLANDRKEFNEINEIIFSMKNTNA